MRVREDGLEIIPSEWNEDEYGQLELECVSPVSYAIDTPAQAQTTETES